MKNSELYQMAMVAVVQADYLLPGVKIDIIARLLTDQRLAEINEQPLGPLPEEDEF